MEHVVVLVPGFLAFDHDRALTYFADRFIASLRVAITDKAKRSVDVIPVSVPAVGSLKERQEALLEQLHEAQPSSRCTWHFVGHSTGGLDAAMLLREKKLAYSDARGSEYGSEPHAVRRIGSVTTIATPHYGTSLVLAPVPAGTSAGATPRERLAAFAGLYPLARSTLQRDQLATRIRFGTAALAHELGFLGSAVFEDRVTRDLRPEHTTPLTEEPKARRHRDTPVYSIATAAPAPTATNTDDHLFTLLWKWTEENAAQAKPPPRPSTAPAVRIASHPERLPQGRDLEPTWSDGVVNTNRQIYETFAGLVSADHCDVMGRYRRASALDDKVIDPGLFTSGAEFDDDRFFQLIDLVADGISANVR